jgi:hypothetical protein
MAIGAPEAFEGMEAKLEAGALLPTLVLRGRDIFSVKIFLEE